MTLTRSEHSRPRLRGALATAVVFSLVASTNVAVTADAQDTAAGRATNTKISRVVLGIGSDASQANVAWQSKTSETQHLEYWPTNSPGKVTSVESPRGPYNAAVFYPHEATMTGLAPKTEYTYRVGSERNGWSAPRTFTTSTDGDSWNFIAMADAQIGVDTKVAEQSAAWKKAVDVATGEHPDSAFIMHLGDQIEGWGAPIKQLEEFTAPENLQKYRLAVLKGNHETYASERHFQDTYFLPNEDGTSANYFFTYNNVLFIGLDGNRTTPPDIEGHGKFVSDAIAAHGAEADWVIVGIHHAPFSQGSHYLDKDVVALRNDLTPKLSDAGVDLVLGGHDHIYTRTHLMNGATPIIPEGASKTGDILFPKDNEVLYVTSTTATGGKYYDFTDENNQKYPNVREERMHDLAHKSTARWRQDYNPDYTSIDVSPTALTLTTYNINTPYVVDKVTLQKKQDEAPETTTPVESTTQPTTTASTATTTPPSDTSEPSSTTESGSTTSTATPKPNPEPDSPDNSDDPDKTPEAGSSTAGIVLSVLAILFGLLASIAAVIIRDNPQWIQDLRAQFGF